MRTIVEVAEDIKSILNNIERTEEYTGKTLVDINELVDEILSINCYKDSSNNNGWIPVSKRLPDKLEPVNVTWVNRNPEPYYAHIKDIPFVATAFYHNGKWWWYSCVCEDYLSEYGESECDAVDKDIDIIAWQPLSQPYQPRGE